ncbi:hypothetical protein [Tautonia sociabilis]|uniref:OmpH family outer membrane protein n=1 Tax=Tautonia sociabilis TaxID=2080755 RepID=A0A432MI96_9BACT|nr:hypothetical protein [Tautonia sociabilis]RUL87082.1 hypothetical protein TsocGM_14175 [Tautonia sociabilis]
MHRRFAKFLALIVMTSGIGLIPGQSAQAQAQTPGTGTAQLQRQLQFVQFLLNAETNQLRIQERRLAQEQAFVSRIDSITQRIPSSLRQARQVMSLFNQARQQLARFQFQTQLGNVRLLTGQSRIASLLANLSELAPTDARLIRLAQLQAAQGPRVTAVVTATPAQLLTPIPFPGA